MQQHPVPQNVTSYQFRLIGEMTLKQFLELAGGGVVALLFYATNLPETLKWALIILSIFLGFALAFLPIEERPLDLWIIAFIKAIYRPTQYIWKKQAEAPAFFQYTPTPTNPNPNPNTPNTNQNIDHYLTSLPQDEPSNTHETDRLQSVLNLFTQEQSFQDKKTLSAQNSPLDQTFPDKQKPASSSTNNAPAGPTQRSNKKISTTPQKPVKLHQPKKNKKEDTPTNQKVIYQTPPTPTATTTTQKRKPGVAATTSDKLPFPSKPTTKNTVVGMVTTSDNKIIENALIEIKSEEGVPVRATKTNQLGQFFSATPLKNGHYQIEVEKDGHVFDTIDLEVTGQIIEPLEIKAKSA